MSPLPHADARRRWPPRPPDPSDRWAGWSLALRDRFARRSRQGGRSGLLLARPPATASPAARVDQRFVLNVAVSPRIHLRIGGSTHLTRVEQMQPGPSPAARSVLSREATVHADTDIVRGMSAPSASIAREVGPTPSIASRFVQRPTFQPSVGAGRLPGGIPAVVPRLVAAESGRLVVRRVLDDRQRVEERPRTAGVGPVLRHPVTPPAADLPDARGSLAGRPRSDGLSALTRTVRDEPNLSRPVSPPPAPSIDIERLTEQVVRQIDRRIVAHRERLGNLF
jgi:hypothetical protein